MWVGQQVADGRAEDGGGPGDVEVPGTGQLEGAEITEVDGDGVDEAGADLPRRQAERTGQPQREIRLEVAELGPGGRPQLGIDAGEGVAEAGDDGVLQVCGQGKGVLVHESGPRR